MIILYPQSQIKSLHNNDSTQTTDMYLHQTSKSGISMGDSWFPGNVGCVSSSSFPVLGGSSEYAISWIELTARKSPRWPMFQALSAINVKVYTAVPLITVALTPSWDIPDGSRKSIRGAHLPLYPSSQDRKMRSPSSIPADVMLEEQAGAGSGTCRSIWYYSATLCIIIIGLRVTSMNLTEAFTVRELTILLRVDSRPPRFFWIEFLNK